VARADALTTRNVLTGALGPGPAPFTLDQREADASIQRLVQVEARWVRLVIAVLAWRGTDRTFAHYPSAAAHVIVER
jgi:hypothetical protein